jgi:hypothetical protein
MKPSTEAREARFFRHCVSARPLHLGGERMPRGARRKEPASRIVLDRRRGREGGRLRALGLVEGGRDRPEQQRLEPWTVR